MKNRITDLNDNLFAALESVNEQGLSGETLRERIAQAATVAQLGKTIIENNNLVLAAERLKHEIGPGFRVPAQLSYGGNQP